MRISFSKIWHTLFLDERPSIGLSFFRIFVALTIGCHVLPSFFHPADNYFSTAYKTYNPSIFTSEILSLVQSSPDIVVVFFIVLFCVTWLMFLVGLFSQVSCILLTLCCYYFYALNCFHIGTLSWDILLVTLFLMCVSNYHGDYFSIDCMRKANVEAFRTQRPIFIQRLLQMQIASTYLYTALYKISASGNWLTDNPLYYLYNYPPQGVVKQFLFRGFFASHPDLCYVIGIGVIIMELTIPFLLFIPRTRVVAIVMGCVFHVLLVLTLHVPTIFFFLFPAQLLLFINPDHVIAWVERIRAAHRKRGQAQIIYDGQCRFCQASLLILRTMDLWEYLKPVDYHQLSDPKELHPKLTRELCHSQLHLITPQNHLQGGFFIFRDLCFKVPMLYPLIPFVYFPGSGLIGPLLYRWVAKNRYLFHRGHICKDNHCFRD